MMSLFVAPRRPRPCAGIVGFSGALVDGESLKAEALSKPPMLLIHGDADMVVNPACLPHAAELLKGAGIPVQTSLHPGLGHSIDEPGIEESVTFLKRLFG